MRALIALGALLMLASVAVVARAVQPESQPEQSPVAEVPLDGPTTSIGEPTRLRIPSIGVDAGFEPLSIDADGRLPAPAALHGVGWSVDGPEPGEKGTAVIAGHYDTSTGPAVFYTLPEIQVGDEIRVEGSAGESAVFVVRDLRAFEKADLPSWVYEPADGASLRLITCGGEFDDATGHYRENMVVFAERRR